ncbi:hypothetical protein [Novacetimonas cocois]|uniref:Uncharacterized protein n=1 Tax=Novacetimonas cocois TaxID=1747507 RepID=A0A365Z2S5_9PROT|nr:hypothetical protein [Novacetimonas cocois]RBM09645.1 hypothetical protein NJLHNGOC_00975 [Novacetimonas cocois]
MDTPFSNTPHDGARATAHRPVWMNTVRIAVWSVCYFAFYFVQQVSELLAPLVLILGIGWSALPRLMGVVSTSSEGSDPQAHDVIVRVSHAIPDHLNVGSHLLTPSSLIFDGLALMAAAALCATLSAVAARSM